MRFVHSVSDHQIDCHGMLEGLRERVSARGNNEHVLNVELATGVQSSTDHIHHGQGNGRSLDASQIGNVPVQRNPAAQGGRAAGGEGDGEESVRTQTLFVRCSVKVEKTRIYGSLIGSRDTNHPRGNHSIDVPYCRLDTQAPVAILVPVPKLDGLMPSR